MATFLYNNISELIDLEIRNMGIGTKLPSERAMAEKYGVSRNVIRESLRLLGEKGIIEIQPGIGVFVADNSEQRFTKNFEHILQRNESSLLDIVEVRETLETAALLKAIERADENDIALLQESYQRMEKSRKDIAHFNKEDILFHVTLAQSSKNSVYSVILQSFYELIGKRLFQLTQIYPTRVDSAQREHKAIIEALRTRDVESAMRIAHKHYNISDILSGEIKKRYAGTIISES